MGLRRESNDSILPKIDKKYPFNLLYSNKQLLDNSQRSISKIDGPGDIQKLIYKSEQSITPDKIDEIANETCFFNRIPSIKKINDTNFIMSEIEQSKINSPKKVKGFHETLMRRFSSIMNHHSSGNSSSRVHQDFHEEKRLKTQFDANEVKSELKRVYGNMIPLPLITDRSNKKNKSSNMYYETEINDYLSTVQDNTIKRILTQSSIAQQSNHQTQQRNQHFSQVKGPMVPYDIYNDGPISQFRRPQFNKVQYKQQQQQQNGVFHDTIKSGRKRFASNIRLRQLKTNL